MDADTVIVGGGPGGLSAAFFLAPYKKTIVLERLDGGRFDVYHSLCGEGMSEDAFADLSPIGPWHIRNRVEGARLIWPGGKEIYVKCRGYILNRPEFLRELRGRCAERGAEFINGTVKDVRETDRGYGITLSDGRSVRCRNVIGADGAFSVVRKRLFGTFPKVCEPVSHYITETASGNELKIYLDEKYRGTYKWIFPSGGNSSVGFAKEYDTLERYLTSGSRYIPFGGVGDIVKGNAYLVGDAAAMINPVSFGGLKAAMLSGRRAAESVIRGSPKHYLRWWNRSILSSGRFMRFHEALKKWSNEDMAAAAMPFDSRHIVLSSLWAIVSRPWNISMYIGCLSAFKFSW